MTKDGKRIKERADELIREMNKEEYEAFLAEEELKACHGE